MPQVDINTYMTTVFLFSNCFIFGYVFLNLFFFVPMVNAYKVERYLLAMVHLRYLKAKSYLNLFNFFLVGFNFDKKN